MRTCGLESTQFVLDSGGHLPAGDDDDLDVDVGGGQHRPHRLDDEDALLATDLTG